MYIHAHSDAVPSARPLSLHCRAQSRRAPWWTAPGRIGASVTGRGAAVCSTASQTPYQSGWGQGARDPWQYIWGLALLPVVLGVHVYMNNYIYMYMYIVYTVYIIYMYICSFTCYR